MERRYIVYQYNKIMNYNTFDFLKKISYERISGSKKELQCANEIADEVKKRKITPVIEEFEVDAPCIQVAKFEVLEPEYKEYIVTGYGMSGSTAESGIEAEFVYIEDGNDLKLLDVEGKIVLVSGGMGYELYKKLIEKKIAGFVTTSGSVYDVKENTDLEERKLRERHYSKGKIPGVTVRMIDAQQLVLSEPSKVRLTLIQQELKAISQNVIATIPGTDKANEIVAFTAHYDSVRFSTGAYDNGTGSTTILELFNYFVDHQPRRTLKFIWCGSEEAGLLGSKAYVEKHVDELKDYVLCINVDMTGVVLGHDIACCTTEMSGVELIHALGKEVGFAIRARQGVYSSDSTPFADNTVPAISFARISSMGGARIHSRLDVLDFLDEKNYYKTCEFIEKFADRVINSVVMPIDRSMPENMKKELDKYLGRNQEAGK